MAKQSFPKNRSYQEEVEEGLEIVWDTAQRVVSQVLDFKPDGVVSLLHSGWVPVKAAQILWQATQPTPFPPLVKTNLGREKIMLYPGGRKKVGNVNFQGMYSEPIQIGHFLAWLEEQAGWQAELKGQIQAQLPPGEDPERILLVDDWIAEGNTFILALGLLDIIYPQAEKHFVAGQLSWKRGFARRWLELYHPQLLEQLQRSPNEGGLSEGERRAFETLLIRLLPGMEDVNMSSFDWRPVTVSSSLVMKLSAYLPPEEWLALPRYVNETIEDYMEERIYEYQRGILDNYSIINIREGSFFPKLGQDALILRDLWLHEGGITRRQIIEKYNLSSSQASRLLKGMLERGLLTRQGWGRAACYFLHPDAYPATPR